MNLVTILIPVLLMAIKSLELAVIDTTLPAISTTPTEVDQLPDKPPLALKIAVTNQGITIIGADEYLYPEGRPTLPEGVTPPPTVPCKSNGQCRGLDDYDWGDLTLKLTEIKKQAKQDERDNDNVVLIPENNIRYEILVMVMDTSRSNTDIRDEDNKPMDLVRNVVIAGGTNL
jgi:hypothetical protein